MNVTKFCDIDNMPSMDELFKSSTDCNQSFGEGKIITAKVANKTEKGIYVDINYKSEPFVDRSEIRNFDELKIGDDIVVYVEPPENEENDNPQVSVHKAQIQHSWDEIIQNNHEGGTIKGFVKSKVKGGLIVDVGVEAFLPGSQVDVAGIKNLDDYIGQELEFKILKINPERRNIVISRRELLEEERNAKRDILLNELEKGQIRRGIVKNITDFGAFVDLDGMDGLLHVTDMSWARISNPSEIVKRGQEIEVMILDVDRERKRISLGLKQKEGNPWDTCDVKYPKGSRVKGKVVNVMPYGAFVELEEGIEGLIHVSEFSWTKKYNRANELLKEGDEVEAIVLEVNPQEHKISLGLRQTQPNPWDLIKEEFPKGTRIKGKVRNLTGYGAFVQIKDDIDGMIHVSDMSWTRKITHPSEVLKKGDEVEAVIVDVDVENQRISLSMKLVSDDPWQSINEHFAVGQIVEGKVTKLTSFGAFVELEGGIDGLLHISELSDEHVAKVKDVVQIGATVKCRVKSINTDEKRIGLSMRDLDGTSSYAGHVSSASAGGLGGLGGALDEAFAEAKAEKTEEKTEE